MVERPEKTVLKAYVLLALLGALGVHRFYMKRPGAGLFMAVMTIVAVGSYVTGLIQEQSDLMYLGYFCGAVVVSIMIVDLVMIPGMIEELNNPSDDRRISLIAGNLDPSFQATMRHAGREEPGDGPRKSGLPEDYVRPWHKKKEDDPGV